MGPTQGPIQRVQGTLSSGVKQPGREADQLLPFSAEIVRMIGVLFLFAVTPSWQLQGLVYFFFYNLGAKWK